MRYMRSMIFEEKQSPSSVSSLLKEKYFNEHNRLGTCTMLTNVKQLFMSNKGYDTANFTHAYGCDQISGMCLVTIAYSIKDLFKLIY